MRDFRLNSESGFTIQEILVVMIVGSLLVSFSLSLFLFAAKITGRWKEKREVEEVVHRITEQVALDLNRSTALPELSDSLLAVHTGAARFVVYHFSKNNVLRNGVSFGNQLIVYSVSITDANKGSTETVAGDAQRKPLESVAISVTGMQRDYAYTAETVVHLPLSSKELFAYPTVSME